MKHILLSTGVLFMVSMLTVAQDYKAYDDGVAKFKEQDYDAVIVSFTTLLADKEHNKRLDEDLYFYRGQAYYHKNEIEKSLTDLDQSLALNHYQKGIIHWYKARCYDRQGRTTDAEAMYGEALALSKKNKKISAQILADRALFRSRSGNPEGAKEDLALASDLDPTNQEIAKTDLSATRTGSTTVSEEKKTQIIVKNNTSTATEKSSTKPAAKKEPQQGNNTASGSPAPAETSSAVRLIPSIPEAYKDEKRYALVIGNSNYGTKIGNLKNPLNDATDVAAELRKSNFDVQLLTNATYIQIREAMRKFQEKLTEGTKDQTVGLFYYAGHGVQYQDENYLVPIDADVNFEDDIVRMCFPVQRMVLANMERTNSRMNIVILDACRNNPFPAATRSVTQGLAEMKRARGSFIAYATAPGSVASDGTGRNGLYTQELLKAMRKPGLTIEQVFKEVRMNVLRLSGEKQFTWDSSNIIGEFYFKFQ